MGRLLERRGGIPWSGGVVLDVCRGGHTPPTRKPRCFSLSQGEAWSCALAAAPSSSPSSSPSSLRHHRYSHGLPSGYWVLGTPICFLFPVHGEVGVVAPTSERKEFRAQERQTPRAPSWDRLPLVSPPPSGLWAVPFARRVGLSLPPALGLRRPRPSPVCGREGMGAPCSGDSGRTGPGLGAKAGHTRQRPGTSLRPGQPSRVPL